MASLRHYSRSRAHNVWPTEPIAALVAALLVGAPSTASGDTARFAYLACSVDEELNGIDYMNHNNPYRKEQKEAWTLRIDSVALQVSVYDSDRRAFKNITEGGWQYSNHVDRATFTNTAIELSRDGSGNPYVDINIDRRTLAVSGKSTWTDNRHEAETTITGTCSLMSAPETGPDPANKI